MLAKIIFRGHSRRPHPTHPSAQPHRPTSHIAHIAAMRRGGCGKVTPSQPPAASQFRRALRALPGIQTRAKWGAPARRSARTEGPAATPAGGKERLACIDPAPMSRCLAGCVNIPCTRARPYERYRRSRLPKVMTQLCGVAAPRPNTRHPQQASLSLLSLSCNCLCRGGGDSETQPPLPLPPCSGVTDPDP